MPFLPMLSPIMGASYNSSMPLSTLRRPPNPPPSGSAEVSPALCRRNEKVATTIMGASYNSSMPLSTLRRPPNPPPSGSAEVSPALCRRNEKVATTLHELKRGLMASFAPQGPFLMDFRPKEGVSDSGGFSQPPRWCTGLRWSPPASCRVGCLPRPVSCDVPPATARRQDDPWLDG